MPSTLRLILSAFCVVTLGCPANLAAQVATPLAQPTPAVAEATAPGALLPSMDPAADPRQDFYQYATGGWQDRHEIPGDQGGYSAFAAVDDLTQEQLLGLLERLAESDELAVGSDEWKAVQLFAQAMDLETRNALGIEPIAAELAAIDAISSLAELYAFLREAYLTRYVYGFYGIFASPDFADSSVYTAWYSGPSLGLPNRDYYWEHDDSNEPIREAYRAMNARLLEFAGYDSARAEAAAQQVYDLEKRLAEPTLRPQERIDPSNSYNPRPVSDLIAANPDFDWPAFLEILGISEQDTVVVPELKYLEAVDDIIAETDLETLKDYLKLQVLQATAGSLSDEIGQAAFAFYGTTMNGIEERRPIEERALDAVNNSLGFALGKLYVDEYFPPEAKAQIEEMVEHIVAATRARIEALAWMTPETKAAALAKLDALNFKVGYPDKWQTYEGVTVEETLPATMLSASLAESKRRLARIGHPVDREEWNALPQEVNAYYSATNNEIVLLAGILQPPFFDYQADLAYNYGATGNTIGHEITHAYDQGGSQFDAEGNLTDWWTADDRAKFEKLTGTLAEQYSAIEVLPGAFVNGELTIRENTADLGGLQIAYDALRAALAEEDDPGLIDGLTQDQRFFIAYALSSVAESRDEALRTRLLTDSHAPLQVRAVQPARNMDAFHEAFGIEPGDPMYLPPEERIVIW
jgi:predicted metalloendopeptidase